MRTSRILLLDKSHLCALVNCDVFVEHGYEVIEANSGADAIAILDQGQPLAALVTAVNLPPGPDGFQVARHARLTHPGLPVIYVSGVSPERHAAEGVVDSLLIPKPFDPAAVVEALGRMGA